MEGVLVYRQTREIIKRGAYLDINGVPISGFGLADTGSTYEWLINYVVDSTPSGYEYDPRYFSVLKTEDKSAGIEHPDYPGVGAFTITFSLEPTTIEDRLAALESAENDANYNVMPINKQLKHIVIAINALRRYVQGITLEQYEETVLGRVNVFANKIASNYAVA